MILRPMMAATAVAAALVVSSVFAQDTGLPIRAVGESELPSDQHDSRSIETLRNLLLASPKIDSNFSAQGARDLSLDPGENAVVVVARGQLNRIVTPFAQPTLKTAATLVTEIEQGIVYLATDSDRPISVYIHDKGRPYESIALTLVPKDVPPSEVRVTLNGYNAEDVRRDDLPSFLDGTDQYLTAIADLMRAVARQEIPEGFVLREIHDTQPVPCRTQAGLSLVPAQELVGKELTVLVITVRNTGYDPVLIEESDCQGQGVIAAALHPSRYLLPGEATEMFVGYRLVPEATPRAPARPSTIERTL